MPEFWDSEHAGNAGDAVDGWQSMCAKMTVEMRNRQ